MGAAFLCAHCGIENRTIEESASYIQGWLARLRDDRKLVVHAAAQAQKACDFIRRDNPDKTQEDQESSQHAAGACRQSGTPAKRYEGKRTDYGAFVTVDGRALDPRLDLYNHSPDGFEWGFLMAIQRHQAGDWGALDAEDWQTNEHALKHGGRLFSQYHSSAGLKFWVITEASREATTVLLPEDY